MKIISKKYWQDMKTFNKIRGFLLNQDEFGSNCAVEKHTKISVKLSIKIRISADIQMSKYRPIISVDRLFGWSLMQTIPKLFQKRLRRNISTHLHIVC